MSQRVAFGYHKSNQALVERLDQDLIKRGIEAWIDTRDIPPGSSKRKAIYEAIAASEFFLACLSPQFLEDEFCRTQLFMARAYDKHILPALVSDSWPENNVVDTFVKAGSKHSHAVKGIEELHYLDFSGKHDTWSGGSYEKNFEKLVDTIQPVPKPEPLNSRLTYFSYHWHDTEFANRLARDIQLARGLVWIDTLAINAGENWRAAMYSGLRKAGQLVVCLSPEAVQSENVTHEVLLAKMRGLHILPAISARVYRDEALKAQLTKLIERSEDLRFLADVEPFAPVPNYQTLLEKLRVEIGLTQAGHKRKEGIFLSYRRADSQAMTGRIHEKLVEAFGPETVFMDVDNIPPGEDFAAYYQGWLRREAVVMLIMIGKSWTSIKKSDKDALPRLHDDRDHVRIEVASALEMPDLKVIPVLVSAVDMPESEELPESLRRLTELQAISVRDDRDFKGDVAKLIETLRGAGRPARTGRSSDSLT